jgi:hypothetical protein
VDQIPEKFEVEHQIGRDLRVHDPALGYSYNFSAKNGAADAVFYDFLTTPAAYRALDIAQLAKGRLEERVPRLHTFKRWDHAAGTLETVRHFGHERGHSEDKIALFGLAAAIGDLAHGVKSHATDIMVEGPGQTEDFHDTRAEQAVKHGGVAQVLQKHGVGLQVTKDGKITNQLPSWVETDLPDICVDRANYIAGEASVWFPGNEAVRSAISLEALTTTKDGRMAFKDLENARVWGKLGLIFSSEHWNDPIDRTILMVMVETIKQSVLNRYLPGIDDMDNGTPAKVEDYTFLNDDIFDQTLKERANHQHYPDRFMTAARYLLRDIGVTERERFEAHKREAYLDFIEDELAADYPSELVNPDSAKYGPKPVSIDFLAADEHAEAVKEAEDKGTNIFTLNDEPMGVIKHLKKRIYDPLVVTKSGPVRVSQADPNYKQLMKQNDEAVSCVSSIRLLMNEEVRKEFAEAIADNNDRMRQPLRSLQPDELRRMIDLSAQSALELSKESGVWKE